MVPCPTATGAAIDVDDTEMVDGCRALSASQSRQHFEGVSSTSPTRHRFRPHVRC